MHICESVLYRSEQGFLSTRDRFQPGFCKANPSVTVLLIEKSALFTAAFGSGQGGSLGTIPVE